MSQFENAEFQTSLRASLEKLGIKAGEVETVEPDENLDGDAESVLEGVNPNPGAGLQSGADELEGENLEGESGDKALGDGHYTVSKLAEAIGWEAADLYTDLVVPFGNGESMTLGQMKDERDQLLSQQAEVGQMREQMQQQYQQFQVQMRQWMQGQQRVSQEVQQAQDEVSAIKAQYASYDWEGLERDNEGRAANLKQKFAQALSQAQGQLQGAVQRQQQAMQQYHQQMMVAEHQKAVGLVEEWKDPAVMQAEIPQMQQYAMSKGFSPQELQSIHSGAAKAILRDAWLWSKHKQEVAAATNKVRNAPKPVMRPGAGGAQVMRSKAQQQNVEKLSNQAKKTGRMQDKLAAARAIVRNSN